MGSPLADYVRPSGTDYPFSTDNVQKFVAFLQGRGGFRIC
jgi:hypothetical protein